MCVILHVTQPVTCFETRYTIESQCWDVARVWEANALAWSQRSHLSPSDSVWCLTPQQMRDLNAFKEAKR
jgi:hypothetical protein